MSTGSAAFSRSRPRAKACGSSSKLPDDVLRYCVEKGSVTIDGVSLTVAELADDAFAVALVPHTLEVTTLSALVPGRQVNLEVDVLAKYVERVLSWRQIHGA